MLWLWLNSWNKTPGWRRWCIQVHAVFITVGGGGYVTMFRGIFVNNFLLNVQLEKIFLPPPPKQKGIGISWVWGGFYD